MTLLLISALLFGGAVDPMHNLVTKAKAGVLSSDYKGTPFGSFMPYVLDKEGTPIIFVSDLARHTQNINTNPKCSLIVHKLISKDIFNSPRITLIGKMVKISDKERKAIAKDYLKVHSGAEDFIDFADFNFYRLEISSIYWVGQFGDIQEVEVADYRKLFK